VTAPSSCCGGPNGQPISELGFAIGRPIRGGAGANGAAATVAAVRLEVVSEVKTQGNDGGTCDIFSSSIIAIEKQLNFSFRYNNYWILNPK